MTRRLPPRARGARLRGGGISTSCAGLPEPRFSFRYFLPAPPLRATMTTYYVLDVGGEEPIEELLFPEWANFRLLLDAEWTQTSGDGRVATHAPPIALMSGTISRTARVRGSPGRVVGAGFLPAGWAAFTDLPARDYVDRITPLSTFVGAAADQLMAAVLAAPDDVAIVAALDAWFLGRMAAAPAT